MLSSHGAPLILDGQATAEQIREELRELNRVRLLSGRRPPHLTAVLVGNDGGSETYVAHKIKACESVGFGSEIIRLEATVTQQELMEVVHRLNQDSEVDGYIVQLPLPSHLDATEVNLAIAPTKDVDGFHPINIGRMAKGLPAYISATPQGVLDLLAYYKIETAGKHCVVVGPCQIVGFPMSILMQRNHPVGNCTVTLTHSRTTNLEEICSQGDIVIAALGIPEFIKAAHIKPGAVVIDVGINRLPDGKLCGDVDFESAKEVAGYITPVPGGVGPMTITMLLMNTLEAAERE